MASRVCRTPDGNQESRVQTRKSYTREYKLKVVRFYHQNNLYQTSKRFSLNTNTIGRWVADEGKIKNSKKASKRMKHSRRCQFLEMEEELYRESKKLRKQGYKVKGFWFRIRGKEILQQMNPDIFSSLNHGSTDSSLEIESALGNQQMCARNHSRQERSCSTVS